MALGALRQTCAVGTSRLRDGFFFADGFYGSADFAVRPTRGTVGKASEALHAARAEQQTFILSFNRFIADASARKRLMALASCFTPP
jgi:hypothetical protein